MSNVQSQITITFAKETIVTAQNKVLGPASKPREQANKLRNYFNALAGGDRDAKVVVQVNSGDSVKASGTITLSAFANNDTFTIGSETFTCKTSGASGNNQFNIGGTDTLSAVAAIAKVNAHPNLLQAVVATNLAGVITVTCIVAGKIGNYINIAISAHGSVSGSVLASGADATTYSTQNTYHLGV